MLTNVANNTTNEYCTRRRRVFQLGFTAIAASLTAPALADAASTPDPVVVLFRRYKALEVVRAPVDARAGALRDEFVRKYGEITSSSSASVFWHQDSNHPELVRLNTECDLMFNAQCLIRDEIIETAATTEGAAVKLHVALMFWRGMTDMEYYEESTLALINDALRVLEGADA